MSVPIEAGAADGTRVVLATMATSASREAQCAYPGCLTTLQRTLTGDLYAGVRAHYQTVHPDRRVQ